MRDGELSLIAVAPLLAPDPIAWLCPMFRIETVLRAEIREYTNLRDHVSKARSCWDNLPNRRPLASCGAIARSRRSS